MICYFDTSFILSAVLEERPQEDHATAPTRRAEASSKSGPRGRWLAAGGNFARIPYG